MNTYGPQIGQQLQQQRRQQQQQQQQKQRQQQQQQSADVSNPGNTTQTRPAPASMMPGAQPRLPPNAVPLQGPNRTSANDPQPNVSDTG